MNQSQSRLKIFSCQMDDYNDVEFLRDRYRAKYANLDRRVPSKYADEGDKELTHAKY